MAIWYPLDTFTNDEDVSLALYPNASLTWTKFSGAGLSDLTVDADLGRLVKTGAVASTGYALDLGEGCEDMVVSCKMWGHAPEADIYSGSAFILRASVASAVSSGYYFRIIPAFQTIQVYVNTAGSGPQLGSNVPVTFSPSTPIDIQFGVVGNLVTIKIDGVTVFEEEDDTFATGTIVAMGGDLGSNGFGDEAYAIDDLEITSSFGAPPPDGPTVEDVEAIYATAQPWLNKIPTCSELRQKQMTFEDALAEQTDGTTAVGIALTFCGDLLLHPLSNAAHKELSAIMNDAFTILL